jgi:hypothetical protein
VGEIGGGFRHFDWNIELDAGVAEPFAESARNENDGGFAEMGFAERFVMVIGGIEFRQIDLVRLMRNKPFKRIGSGFCFGEQFPSIGNIAGQSAGVGGVNSTQALKKSRFGLVVNAGSVPVCEQMALIRVQELSNQRLFFFFISQVMEFHGLFLQRDARGGTRTRTIFRSRDFSTSGRSAAGGKSSPI